MLTGLTGGIGSGKSTVAKCLRGMGYAVYDCDSQAKRILIDNEEVRRKIKDLFGEAAYDEKDGHICYNTKLVAAEVFGDSGKLQQLNAIVHPAVCEDVTKWSKGREVCFVESAILYESHLNEICDKVVAVVAPMDLRIKRTMQRDRAEEEQVRRRIASQLSDEWLIEHADFIVHNDETQSVETLATEIITFIK